jgi:hypothetical protein
MDLDQTVTESLQSFVKESDFARTGAVMTDLDGTALHEEAGRIYIPKPVEFGFKALHDLGRPFVLNTLRFPLSVLRTFGRDWYSISNSPIPAITLNGSMLGLVTTAGDEMAFEEIAAFPLAAGEIDSVVDMAGELIAGDLKNLLLFYYPRDWPMGEIIWTPTADKVIAVKEKYTSASSVTAVEMEKLRKQLHDEEICMIFLLVEATHEQLMAYQHTSPSSFFTADRVDKLWGARQLARLLNFDLEQSLGAGDTEMDKFLNGVGMAVIVGPLQLEYKGLRSTLRLKDSFELGDALFQLAGMIKVSA